MFQVALTFISYIEGTSQCEDGMNWVSEYDDFLYVRDDLGHTL
jgi:hypothetical protein